MIETPRGRIILGTNGKAELKFHPGFAPKWTRRYTRAQMFVDSEVLRLSEPFVPLLTGTLIKTGILGTDVGSGRVQWIAPYARSQYYRGRAPGQSQTGPLRGRYWFERMKEVHGAKIIEGAKKIAGRS
jgi:Minor capsid protein